MRTEMLELSPDLPEAMVEGTLILVIGDLDTVTLLVARYDETSVGDHRGAVLGGIDRRLGQAKQSLAGRSAGQ
jgi:hypothetical protein